MKDTFAIVFANHGNPLLGDLIAHRCVSAIPLAGRFRTIDVLLSNLSKSGVRDVGVIMQRNFQSLVEHLGSGDAWDLNSKRGGLAVLSPFDQGMGTVLYSGFGDALFAKRYYINRQRARNCLLLESDTVYRQDYNALLDKQRQTGADIVFLCSHDRRLASSDRPGAARIVVDADGWVRHVEYPQNPDDGAVFYLGACLMDKDLLVRLVEDSCAEGRYDFTTDILEPALAAYKVAMVEHTGYASRISSVKSYFDTAHDMLGFDVRDELFFRNGPVYTRAMDAPPVRYAAGCHVENSVFGNGCDIRGSVVGSEVFRGVTVEAGADVKNCVIMQDSHIGAGAHLRNAIIDKNVVVEPGARIVGTPDLPAMVRKGSIIEGAM